MEFLSYFPSFGELMLAVAFIELAALSLIFEYA
jgi:hypothetical protein